jgi:methionyl-tRNA formyltransferase
MRPVPGAVKRLALARGLELFQPETLRSADALGRLRAARPEAIVVGAYGLLLPQAVLDLAPLGALNIHASLLPRWRGAAPIQRALLSGDLETGISIMRMEAGLDTGPVLAQSPIAIAADDDAGTLHDKLAALGGEQIVAVLKALQAGNVHSVAQPNEGVAYAAKIGKADIWLDWSRPAAELERSVRAFRPSPGAVTRLDGVPLKVWRASVVDGGGVPGTVLDAGKALVVACRDKALAIEELQRPGGRRMAAEEFLRGRAVQPGARFG